MLGKFLQVSTLVALAGCAYENQVVKSSAAGEARSPEFPVAPIIDVGFGEGLPAGWSFDDGLGMVRYELVDRVQAQVRFKALRIVPNEKFDRSQQGKYDQNIQMLSSPLFAVKPGQGVAVAVEAFGNVNMKASVTRFRAKENQLRSFLPATAVRWYDSERRPLLAQDPTGAMLPIGASFGFKTLGSGFERTLFTTEAPAKASFARVQLGGEYPAIVGDKWLEYKRVAVMLRPGPDSNWDFGDLRAPRMERVSPSPSPDRLTPFVFTVKDESEIKSVRMTLDGRELSPAECTRRAIESGFEYTYRPTTPWAPDSLHRLRVEATDASGNVDAETLAYYCGEPMPGTQWSIRDDGMYLKDGVPFFPIGTSGARLGPANGYDCDRLMRQLAENGFNNVQCMYSYRPGGKAYYDGGKGHQGECPLSELEAYLAAAKKYGVSLYVEPARRNYGTEERVRDFVEVLKFFRAHDVVSTWELADDMASHVTENLVRDDANIVRAIDTKHIVGCSDAVDYHGRFLPYAPSFDMINAQMYPFRNAEPEPEGLSKFNSICDILRTDIRKVGARTTLNSVVQAFSGWGLWKTFPTPELIRAQTYLAIINGCRGVTYYTYYTHTPNGITFTSTPERMESVFRVTRELKALTPDLVSRDAKLQPAVKVVKGPAADPCGFVPVSCLLKESGLLLAASSMVKGDCEVEIQLPNEFRQAESLKVERLFVAGGAVEIDARRGVLRDRFPAQAVHVYRIYPVGHSNE